MSGQKRYWYAARLVAAFHLWYIGFNFVLAGLVILYSFEREWGAAGSFAEMLLLSKVVAVMFNAYYKGCPLTKFENALRRQYNPQMVYQGSFAVHVAEWFGIEISNRFVTSITATLFLVGASVVILQNLG